MRLFKIAPKVENMETIKTATSEDIPQLADLMGHLFAQEAEFSVDREKQLAGLRQIVGSQAVGRIFVARSAGTIVGMVSILFTVSTAEGGPVCWLEDMIVLPDYRGRAIGSRLIEHAIACAQAEGFRRITLLTDCVNEHAVRFYRRHGFQVSEMTVMRRNL